MKDEPKVLCRSPNKGKKGTKIHKWKYDLIRNAILEVVPKDDVGILY
jgi:hypothetical protein